MAAMEPMADPILPLISLQKAIDSGAFNPPDLKGAYLELIDEFPGGRKRYSYVKIVGAEVQALSIFGLEDPFKNIARYSVGYAVVETHRRRGLAVEAVNVGLETLSKELRLAKTERFYLEAVIEVTNLPSIKTAQKLFPGPGRPMTDSCSGRPALLFSKLVIL